MHRWGLRAEVATQIVCDVRRRFFDYRDRSKMAEATSYARGVSYIFHMVEELSKRYRGQTRRLGRKQQAELDQLMFTAASRIGNNLMHAIAFVQKAASLLPHISSTMRVAVAYYLALAGNNNNFNLWQLYLLPLDAAPRLQRHKVDPADAMHVVEKLAPIFTRPNRVLGGKRAIEKIAPYMKKGRASMDMLQDLIPVERSARYKKDCVRIINLHCNPDE